MEIKVKSFMARNCLIDVRGVVQGSPPVPPEFNVVVCPSGRAMEIKVKSQKREPISRSATLIPGGQGDKPTFPFRIVCRSIHDKGNLFTFISIYGQEISGTAVQCGCSLNVASKF